MQTITKIGAIIIKNKKLLAVHKQNKPAHQLIVPGGVVESNETDLQALTRELKEELSISLRKIDFFKKYEAKAIYENKWLIMKTYFAYYEGALRPNLEIDHFHWVDSLTTHFQLASILGKQLIPDLVQEKLIG